MQRTKERVRYIDIAKGIGMLLVIWGHIRETGLGNAMIYAFHMPLFFILSGIMYSKEKYSSIGQLIRKRVHTILIPYGIYSVVTWFVWVGYNTVLGNDVESIWMPLLQTVLSQGSGGYLVHNSPLWFVTCLFVVEIIYFYTSKLSDKKNILVCGVIAVIGNLLIVDGSPLRHMVWNIDMAMCAVPFYAFGNLAKEKIGLLKFENTIQQKKRLAWIAVAAAFCIVMVGAKLNGPVSMGHRKLNITILFYCVAVVGSTGCIILSALLSRIKLRGVLFLQWFGNHSFDVMAVQTPIKGVAVVIVAKLLHMTTGQISDTTQYSCIAFLIAIIPIVCTVFSVQQFKSFFRRR